MKCFIFILRISKRFTCCPQEQSKGCPEGIPGFSLQFLSSIKKCCTSFPKVPSAPSSLANTEQSTQTLLQAMLPRAQPFVTLVSEITGADQRERNHFHFCSHHNMQPGNFVPSPTPFPWTMLKHAAGSLLVNQ